MSTDARVDALEFKVAHLERALQELSDVLFQQQRLIDLLQTRHAQLLERLDSAGGAADPTSQFEIPPHY